MAGCFVPSIDFDASGDNLELKMQVLFFGAGLKDLSIVAATILAGDTLAQVKGKIVTAILSEAAALGYSVPAANMILPSFQKGA